MPANLRDSIIDAVNAKPVDFKEKVSEVLDQKATEALESYRAYIAKNLFKEDEDLLETFLAEISKKTLGSYIEKASVDSNAAAVGGVMTKSLAVRKDRGSPEEKRESELADKLFKKSENRLNGIKKAVNKLVKEEDLTEEEFELLSEISKETLGSYVKRAQSDVDYFKDAARSAEETALNSKKLSSDQIKKISIVADKFRDKSDKRLSGIHKAVNKLVKEEDLTEEEFELLSEISKETLGSYIKKASDDIGINSALGVLSKTFSVKHAPGSPEEKRGSEKAKELFDKANKRRSGIEKAVNKLVKEEDLTEEEYELLSEISKETLKSYIGKAKEDALDMGDAVKLIKKASEKETPGYAKISNQIANHLSDKVKKRKTAIAKAASLVKEEDLEEKKTLTPDTKSNLYDLQGDDIKKLLKNQKIEVTPDANGNDDKAFKANYIDLSTIEDTKHGYQPGQDVAAYKENN